MQEPLATTTILDDALLTYFDIAMALREKALGKDGANKVGRVGGTAVGSSNGALLQAVKLEIGIRKCIGNLALKRGSEVALWTFSLGHGSSLPRTHLDKGP